MIFPKALPLIRTGMLMLPVPRTQMTFQPLPGHFSPSMPMAKVRHLFLYIGSLDPPMPL
jgi:hypothetical protein